MSNNLSVEIIKKLYYNKELSTSEIADELGIHPSRVWRFMAKNNLPRRTVQEANEKGFDRRLGKFFVKQNLSLEERELKTAGIMLYWAEGCKLNSITKANVVDFANSSPQMIMLFLRFLREICGIQEKRLRVLLYCYADQDVMALKKYWNRITDISLTQFIKPYIRKDFLPEKSGKMKYGLVHIRYCDKKLLIQIEDWIKAYLEKNNI